MIYQIQTKFRDEPRARGGLIRVREFTMKDAYSFHTSEEDLDKYYEVQFKAYENIFRRAGAKNVVAVKSDSGMMGGNVSHEFMLLSDIGEDTIAICPTCGYSANMEAADVVIKNESTGIAELTKVHTPDAKSIEEVCSFLKADTKSSMKAVVYQRNSDDSYVIVFIRGDLEVNETKLRNYLKYEIHPGIVTEESGICAGFIGPVNAPAGVKLVFDASLKGIDSLICGANETDYHYTGLNIARDLGDVEFVDVAKIFEGAICPVCGQPHITINKGIEIGNIFKLGTKYTKSMDMTYLDADGVTTNNSTKGNASLIADVLGDWREELLVRTTDSSALRIFISTELSGHKIYTLMHDAQYRAQVVCQQTAYNQPAYPSFYLASDMEFSQIPLAY